MSTAERRDAKGILKETCVSLSPQDLSGDENLERRAEIDPVIDRLLELPGRESHKKPIG